MLAARPAPDYHPDVHPCRPASLARVKVPAMRHTLPVCCRRGALVVAALLFAAVPANADEPKPPKGFTALFNGKDLGGWHGRPHIDPTKLE
jgi:hypothetical protein